MPFLFIFSKKYHDKKEKVLIITPEFKSSATYCTYTCTQQQYTTRGGTKYRYYCEYCSTAGCTVVVRPTFVATVCEVCEATFTFDGRRHIVATLLLLPVRTEYAYVPIQQPYRVGKKVEVFGCIRSVRSLAHNSTTLYYSQSREDVDPSYSD